MAPNRTTSVVVPLVLSDVAAACQLIGAVDDEGTIVEVDLAHEVVNRPLMTVAPDGVQDALFDDADDVVAIVHWLRRLRLPCSRSLRLDAIVVGLPLGDRLLTLSRI